MNIQFSVVHKKVNISSDYTPWEHEQFSKKHVLGMTLSGLATPGKGEERENGQKGKRCEGREDRG
jgi:hypothetical protein